MGHTTVATGREKLEGSTRLPCVLIRIMIRFKLQSSGWCIPASCIRDNLRVFLAPQAFLCYLFIDISISVHNKMVCGERNKRMGKFNFISTGIPGVWIIEPTVFGDERGYFMETYSHKEFAAAGISGPFVQDNQSKSTKGVLRGLHFQKQHPQGKLVRVISGEVFDVAVDCRPNSPTFGKWEGVRLSAQNKRQFYIPQGFAHGFLVLSDEAEFTYKCTDFYAPDDEGGVAWNDPQLGIIWPQVDCEVKLSAKDKLHAGFAGQDFSFFEKW